MQRLWQNPALIVDQLPGPGSFTKCCSDCEYVQSVLPSALVNISEQPSEVHHTFQALFLQLLFLLQHVPLPVYPTVCHVR